MIATCWANRVTHSCRRSIERIDMESALVRRWHDRLGFRKKAKARVDRRVVVRRGPAAKDFKPIYLTVGHSGENHQKSTLQLSDPRNWTMFLKKLLSAFLRFFQGSKEQPERRRDVSRSIVQLQRWSGADRPPPMMWKDCHPRTRATFKAELTCSNGHGVSLRGHSVTQDGRVSPSVVCLAPGCSFHDFVRLNGWSAGSL